LFVFLIIIMNWFLSDSLIFKCSLVYIYRVKGYIRLVGKYATGRPSRNSHVSLSVRINAEIAKTIKARKLE